MPNSNKRHRFSEAGYIMDIVTISLNYVTYKNVPALLNSMSPFN